MSQRSSAISAKMITSPKLKRAIDNNSNYEPVSNVVKSLESERRYDYIKSVLIGIICIAYGTTVFVIQFV